MPLLAHSHERTALSGKIIVITGASSGLGRETAIQFANQGAFVVLAARRQSALQETAAMCGGEARALPITTDVTIEQQVQLLVERTMERFGRIDIWINNAGVTLFARLDQGSFEEHRRVIETNLFGAMLCVRAVLPIFRRQHSGIVINVGSILSKVGQPFVPSYVISKFGLRGLSEALRTDVADEPGIHVCSVFPYVIDTPHFETAANLIGLKARAMPPVQEASTVARAIVGLAKRPRRERHVPRVAALGVMLHGLFPNFFERVLLQVLSEWHFEKQTEPKTSGSLYTPLPGRAEVTGHRRPRISLVGLLAWVATRFVRILTRPAPRPSR